MDDQKRGEDAADHAPKPGKPDGGRSSGAEQPQEAENDRERTDGGRAIKGEDLSSANDE